MLCVLITGCLFCLLLLIVLCLLWEFAIWFKLFGLWVLCLRCFGVMMWVVIWFGVSFGCLCLGLWCYVRFAIQVCRCWRCFLCLDYFRISVWCRISVCVWNLVVLFSFGWVGLWCLGVCLSLGIDLAFVGFFLVGLMLYLVVVQCLLFICLFVWFMVFLGSVVWYLVWNSAELCWLFGFVDFVLTCV